MISSKRGKANSLNSVAVAAAVVVSVSQLCSNLQLNFADFCTPDLSHLIDISLQFNAIMNQCVFCAMF